MTKKGTKNKPTVIDYTLEEHIARRKLTDKTIDVLGKLANVVEKQQNALILYDHRIKKLEKKK